MCAGQGCKGGYCTTTAGQQLQCVLLTHTGITQSGTGGESLLNPSFMTMAWRAANTHCLPALTAPSPLTP